MFKKYISSLCLKGLLGIKKYLELLIIISKTWTQMYNYELMQFLLKQIDS